MIKSLEAICDAGVKHARSGHRARHLQRTATAKAANSQAAADNNNNNSGDEAKTTRNSNDSSAATAAAAAVADANHSATVAAASEAAAAAAATAVAIPTDVKLAFFNETRHAFGRTALLLSGGAALGFYHVGLITALIRNRILPKVISGSVQCVTC